MSLLRTIGLLVFLTLNTVAFKIFRQSTKHSRRRPGEPPSRLAVVLIWTARLWVAVMTLASCFVVFILVRMLIDTFA